MESILWRRIPTPWSGSAAAVEMEQKELRERIDSGIRSLKPDDRAVILLHDLQEIPYEEIARILGIPLGTVKSRLHRARLALKARLAPYFKAIGEKP